MVSEAQKRAAAKYAKHNMVQRAVSFSPNERDILAWLDSHDNRAGYIKSLIRKDMCANSCHLVPIQPAPDDPSTTE